MSSWTRIFRPLISVIKSGFPNTKWCKRLFQCVTVWCQSAHQVLSLYATSCFSQSRHCTDWVGCHGPEPHHEHEWPWLCGKTLTSFSLHLSWYIVFCCSLNENSISSQQVCAYNRTVSKVHDFLQNEAKGSKVIGAESLEDMVAKLKKPRRVILLVKAGQAVDDFIDKLVSVLLKKTSGKSVLMYFFFLIHGGTNVQPDLSVFILNRELTIIPTAVEMIE